MAPNLERCAPRSPYASLSEQFPAVAARLVDKCRAELLGQSGSYEYNCPLDRQFFAAAGLEAEALRQFIATGADDNEVAAWMDTNAKMAGEKIVEWGRRFCRNSVLPLLGFEDWLPCPWRGPERGLRLTAP